MMTARCLALLSVSATVLLAPRTPAQSGPGAPGPVPRVGLALSGGAARGLAHIGVLKVLEDAGVPVSVVAGTSMGSVIGGLYAIGYTAAQLDSIVTAQDWHSLLTDAVRRRDLVVDRKFTGDHYILTLPIHAGGIRLPRGAVPGQRITELLTGLTWPAHAVRDLRKLPIPFVAVATDIETGEAKALESGFLPDVIRASVSIPSVFSPAELDGRVYIDGSISRNLPAQDARALGADLLICSDVTDPLEPPDSIVSLVGVLAQAVSFRTWDSEAEQRRQCDVLITPDVRAFSTFGFDRRAALIARGEAAARTALPAIEAALSRASARREPRRQLAAQESTLVAAVRFEGERQVPEGFLAGMLRLRPPRWVSRRDMDEGIDRLYATGLFESVGYRLEPLPGGRPDQRVLRVVVREPVTGRFGVGLRYDSRYKASVLLTGMLGGTGLGANARMDVRLGQQIAVGLGLAPSLGYGRTVSLGGRVDYVHNPFDLFAAGHRVAQASVDLGAATVSIRRSLGRAAQLSTSLKAEHARWDDEVSAVDSPAIHRTFFSAAGVALVDTYDRGFFPSRGVGLRAHSEWGDRLLGGGGAFSHHCVDLHWYVPVFRTVSVWSGLTVGASGGTPPPHYQFFLGGANAFYLFPDRDISFVGLSTQELRGRHVQKVELGAQWEFAHDWFGRIRWNAGNVYDRWTWDPGGYVDGAGLEVGAKTFAGRLSLTVSGSDRSPGPKVELDLGTSF